MDIISTEELKRIAEYGKLMHESDVGSALDYNEFSTAHKQAIDSLKGPGPLDAKLYLAFQDVCSSWLKDHSPPIVRVGKGSSRVAFRCGDGTCLKVAYNTKGLGQNKQEIQNFASTSGNELYECFTKMYRYDKENYASLLTECCSLIQTQEEYSKFFGRRKFYGNRDVWYMMSILDDVLVDHNDRSRFKSLRELEAYINKPRDIESDDEEDYVDVFNNILHSSQPQWKVLKSLVQFMIDTNC